MTFTPDTTVGELAGRFPATVTVFHRHGLEFCCGGARTLARACRDSEVGYDQLAAELSDVIHRAPRRVTWIDRPLSDLVSHIVEAFHEPLRQEMPRLGRLAERVRDHGSAERHVLSAVHYQIVRFGAELSAQIGIEERDLFPLITRIESSGRIDGDLARFSPLRAQAEACHVDAAQTVKTLRHITGGYVPPSTACSAVRALYRGLQDLDALMQLHVHLERHVLFSRAAALAAEAGAGDSQ